MVEYQIPQWSDITSPSQEGARVEVRRLTWKDKERIEEIAKDPSIWPFISNDATPPVEEWGVQGALAQEYNYFLGIYLNGEVVGFWMVLARGAGVYEVHTCVLPVARGRVVTEAMPLALHHMFTHTPAMILTTQVPRSNPAALKLAHWAGFKPTFTVPNGWAKDGETCDLDHLYLPLLTWFVERCGNAERVVSELALSGNHVKMADLHLLFTTLLPTYPPGK